MSLAVNGESAAGEKSPHSVGDDPKREGNQDVDINIYEINEMLSESINEEQHNENPTQLHVTYEDKQKRPITPEHGDDVESESKRQRTDNSLDANTKVDSTKNTIANDGELEYIEQRSTNAEKNESKVTSNDEMPDEQPSQTEESPRTVYHDGIAVPANSELLNTNTAFAAYNALSSHFPPLSSISNAHLSDLPLPIIAPDYIPPRIQLLINTLPTLDNLCTQILRIVAITPYQKVVDLASNPESPSGATYRDLISLFEFTKKLYSEEDPFLTVEHIAPGMWKEGEKTPSMLRNREQSIESTLRKVNLATFLVAALGTIEVGFFHLNESFLDVFCPANSLEPENTITNMNPDDTSLQGGLTSAIGDKVGKLLKPQAELFLELKTQAFISALEAGDRTRKEIIEDIIPENLGQLLLARRDTTILSPTEQDFLDRCAARRDILLNYPEDRNIADEYDWFAFLKELFDYISKNVGSIIWGKKTKGIKKSIPSVSKDVSNEEELIRSASTIPASEQSSGQMSPKGDLGSLEISELASSLLPSEIQEQQLHLRINPSSNVRNLQRRPWTRDEEKALRHALELKGPLWSTILELFGNGGKISEALKNRTQVQLKDKARNWKMFFLKSGLPVPNYLQKVTGDLERDDRLRANKRANKNKKNILMNHSPAESQSPGLEDVKR